MLTLPTRGISRSIKKHNVELDVFCDWIEGSVLFVDEELSSSDIVDALREDNVYESQDMAAEMVGNAWTELKRRAQCMEPGVAFTIEGRRISRQFASWEETPAQSFCLVLSLAKWYRDWANAFGSDYTEQGSLFEDLTKESLERLFGGWTIHQTGWARTRVNNLRAVVEDVGRHLGETLGEIERWTRPRAKEAGLDILCYRPFPDKRAGIPVYLMQCASGGDWEGKLHTPKLSTWNKVITFTIPPQKAFATPFAFLEDDFRINSNSVEGMLLDRCRLLSVDAGEADWVSASLGARIIAWAAPRIASLPRRDT